LSVESSQFVDSSVGPTVDPGVRSTVKPCKHTLRLKGLNKNAAIF